VKEFVDPAFDRLVDCLADTTTITTGIAVMGFFIGGVLGFFAFKVPFFQRYMDLCSCSMPRANQAKQLLTNHSITPQKFEHAALLFNVCLTSACGLVHILYVAYHERMTVISVLESRSECVWGFCVANVV